MLSWKRLRRSEWVLASACWAIQLYVRIVYRTGRWSVAGAEIPARILAEGRPFILAFWHGRLLMMPMAWQGMAPMHMLISAHRDGRIIADAVSYFGIDWVKGSSSDGGLAALRQMVRFIKAGDCVGITPDGPHGPYMRASEGAVAIARLARAPIVPLSYATARRRILRTWDRFHLPLPPTRGVFIWGEPIEVAPDADKQALEAARLLVETRMNAITAEADRRMGNEAVEVGPIGSAAPATGDAAAGGSR
ncbi:MAG TPA: lysophospholipid acyltransferase family protein [Stellaceae bacterium]|nr:lysophospholipid acyltransferase family protein [Stellaceae bacterium]